MRALLFFTAAMAIALPAAAQDSQTSARVDGRFRGLAPGFSQDLVIQKLDADSYSVSASVSSAGCKGAVQGVGKIKGHVMIIKDSAGACTLNLMRAGPNVQIDEEGCDGMHGPSCDFAGTYSRR